MGREGGRGGGGEAGRIEICSEAGLQSGVKDPVFMNCSAWLRIGS